MASIQNLINKLTQFTESGETSQELAGLITTLYFMSQSGFSPFEISKRKADKLKKRLRFVPKNRDKADEFFVKCVKSVITSAALKGNVNAILYNVPTTVVDDGEIVIMDCEQVFATMKSTGIEPVYIVRIDPTTYGLKFNSDDDARTMVQTINGKLYGGNIVKLEFINRPEEEAEEEREQPVEEKTARPTGLVLSGIAAVFALVLFVATLY